LFVLRFSDANEVVFIFTLLAHPGQGSAKFLCKGLDSNILALSQTIYKQMGMVVAQ
jgi:hypothetical protein